MIATKKSLLVPADVDLQKRVGNYLASRYLPNLNRLEVDSRGGVVTIRGRVASFYEKQVAINSCRRVAGVVRLVDCVEVI